MKYSLILISLTFVFFACKKEQTRKNAEANENLKFQIDSLRKQVDLAWDSMIVEDDKKLKYLKRIADEAVYVLNADTAKQMQIHRSVDDLKELRYDRKSMANSDLIDKYDSATDATIRFVFEYLDAYDSSYSAPLIHDLHNDILEFDKMVIHRRGHYDEPAMAFNKHLKEKNENIKNLGNPYSEMKPYPLFVLMPDL